MSSLTLLTFDGTGPEAGFTSVLYTVELGCLVAI